MLVEQVATLFRGYCDDQDTSFLTDANVATYLQQGYAELRNVVFARMPELYEITYSANVTTNSLALAGVMFGKTVTQRRCLRITRVEQVSDTSATATFQGLLDPAASKESLYSDQYWLTPRWLLQGTTLLFSQNMGRAVRINYLPDDNVNWVGGIVPASAEYIDDLTQFHDLIALFAYQQYAIRDFASNGPLNAQYQKRLADLHSFLSMGRTGDADRWVQHESNGW